jgi:serine/threonine protein kinase
MALAAIHNAEVIHRDLKPGNILITKGTPKLIDFGLAKPIADVVEKYHSTKINQVMGTPHYMSPEQWRRTKDVDGKTDVWAIGVTLIDAAGGKPWGRKESYEIQALLHNGKLPDLSALDPAQKALVSVMLIPSPEERWSATKILKNFDAFYNYKEAPAAAQVKVEARPIVAPADQRPRRVEQRNIRVEGNRVVVEPDGRLIDKLVGKKYVTSDGVPIFVGSRVKYLKTGQLGVVTKLDKNDTGYVFVRLMGEDEPKIKSTNQLESVGKLGFLNNGSDQPLIKRYGKDILIFWLATPIGWLIYKYFTDKEVFSRFSTSSSTKGLKFWKIGFLVSHGLTLGLLGPFFSIPLAVKQKRALLYVFAAANLIAVSIFLVGVVNTPNGGTLPTFPTIIMLANYFGAFYLPLVLRLASKKKVES